MTTKRKSKRNKDNIKNVKYLIGILIVAFVLIPAFYYSSITKNHSPSSNIKNMTSSNTNGSTQIQNSNTINLTILSGQISPKTGYTLPFKWGNSIKVLVQTGALNVSNLTIILNSSGQPITFTEKEILNGTYNGYIQFNSTNTEFVQIVLWALGINNNNTIINEGPIINSSAQISNEIRNNSTNSTLRQQATPYFVASHYFASTGGYGPIGKLQLGGINDVILSQPQQIIADYTATNSYRPCCDNPTAFPDCNHGAAALGLIELLASQGATQSQIFDALRYFYQYQFPQQYTEIAAYFYLQGKNYSQINSSEVMGYNFSSFSGYYSVNQYLLKNGILKQSTAGGAACGA